MLTVEEIHDDRGFDALEADWERLFARCDEAGVFSSYPWARNCWRYLGEQQQLRLLVFRDGNTVTGIAPLVRDTTRLGPLRLPKLAILGSGPSDRLNLLFPERQAEHLAACFEHVRRMRGWSILDLRGIPEESPVGQALARAAPIRGMTRLALAPEVLWGTALGPTYAQYEHAHFSSKERSRTRQLWRRLNALGEVRMRFIGDLSNEPDVLDRFRAMPHHTAGRGETYTIPWNMNGRLEFYKTVIGELAKRDQVYLSMIELGNRVISYGVGFEYGGMHGSYFSAFDPAYRNVAPGRLLLAALIEHVIERGLREYNFLRGAEAYKLKWADMQRRNLEILYFRNTPGGLLAHAAFHGRASLARRRTAGADAAGGSATAVPQ